MYVKKKKTTVEALVPSSENIYFINVFEFPFIFSYAQIPYLD